MEPIAELVKIGTHDGWDLFFKPGPDSFEATKGRRTVSGNYLRGLIKEINDLDREAARRKERQEPCEFNLWNEKKGIETRVRLTSYSNKGIALKPVNGGETFYIETGGWGGPKPTLNVVKKDADLRRLYTAVEGLRKAKEEMRLATAQSILSLDVKSCSDVGEYHQEEDRLKAEIREALK